MSTPAAHLSEKKGSSEKKTSGDEASNKKPGARKRNTGAATRNKARKANQARIGQDKWNGASLYIRKEPWPKNIAKPQHAIVLVPTVYKNISGDNDEVEYACTFYNENGKVVSALSANISMDNKEAFSDATYATVKDILHGRGGFQRDASGKVSPSNSQNILNGMFNVIRSRAKEKNRSNCGWWSGVVCGAGGLTTGILIGAGIITLPAWAGAAISATAVGAGVYTGGRALGLFCYDKKHKILHCCTTCRSSCCSCSCCPTCKCSPCACNSCDKKACLDSCSRCKSSVCSCFSCSTCCSGCSCQKCRWSKAADQYQTNHAHQRKRLSSAGGDNKDRKDGKEVHTITINSRNSQSPGGSQGSKPPAPKSGQRGSVSNAAGTPKTSAHPGVTSTASRTATSASERPAPRQSPSGRAS